MFVYVKPGAVAFVRMVRRCGRGMSDQDSSHWAQIVFLQGTLGSEVGIVAEIRDGRVEDVMVRRYTGERGKLPLSRCAAESVGISRRRERYRMRNGQYEHSLKAVGRIGIEQGLADLILKTGWVPENINETGGSIAPQDTS